MDFLLGDPSKAPADTGMAAQRQLSRNSSQKWWSRDLRLVAQESHRERPMNSFELAGDGSGWLGIAAWLARQSCDG